MSDRRPDDRPLPVFPEPPQPDDTQDAEVSPEEVAAPAEPESRVFIPRWLLIVLVFVVVAGVGGSLVRIPFFAIGPGSTRDVLTMVGVAGGAPTYPSKGKLLITTVSPSARTLTFWEGVVVWLHPTLSTIEERALRPPGTTGEEQEAENYQQIETSKLDAELAAFAFLGKEVRRSRGALILSILNGSPADGVLRTGDVVVAVEGRRVDRYEDAARLLAEQRRGEAVTLQVLRDGKRRNERITPRVLRPGESPRIGVYLGPVLDLPYDVSINTQEIGGPSGGLVFALSLIDVLIEEDLTRGHVIAVTGTIDADGSVGRIGEADHKVRAAMRDGATVFIVPDEDYELARSAAKPSLRVIPVSTLAEAIQALRNLPPRG